MVLSEIVGFEADDGTSGSSWQHIGSCEDLCGSIWAYGRLWVVELVQVFGWVKLLYGCQVLDPTPNTSGDFAIKIFIKQNGLMGLFSYLLLITSFFCSKNYLIVAILFLTSLHYGFIFSNVGHFILPLFFSGSPKLSFPFCSEL